VRRLERRPAEKEKEECKIFSRIVFESFVPGNLDMNCLITGKADCYSDPLFFSKARLPDVNR
jgi:NADPH-dependent 7-cyano-7-deazaguanine reductase QueF